YSQLLFESLCFHSLFPHFLSLFTDPAPPQIYTLSLHDALPISLRRLRRPVLIARSSSGRCASHLSRTTFRGFFSSSSEGRAGQVDRKSTRLNSSHQIISYAVFCLKKKKTDNIRIHDIYHFYLA